MAPKSSSTAAPPSSRKSARIAEQPKSASVPTPASTNGEKKVISKKDTASKKETNSKKRAADQSSGEQEAKKAKAEEPKSKAKTASKKDQPKAAAAEEEKKAEAPASAKADTGSKGALKEGDKLPKITLKDNEGTDVDVSTLAGEQGVVIFLYPKADTPGCTTQACGYRDHFKEIQDYGYDIYGLSKDKSDAQQKWINKKQLTYKLLCDPESKLIKRLGAFVQPHNTKRSHFIFEKGTGKLVDIALGVKPADE
uniref:thioredoxin-dependent peroxiredoxin n=1 Tax=Kwoniella dejecticola CBS 10117 TaxID=1296121 RepID=A0A1A6AH09_9TREE|nr:uncharacterized protein I303_01113 [Kwoniella dejecticola CBS 10117]OBR89288.1 hypothetical protein I303_01113 [Kwoniella dejecticola CBS 10117]